MAQSTVTQYFILFLLTQLWPNRKAVGASDSQSTGGYGAKRARVGQWSKVRAVPGMYSLCASRESGQVWMEMRRGVRQPVMSTSLQAIAVEFGE